MNSLVMGVAWVLLAAAVGEAKPEELKVLQATLTSAEAGKIKVVFRNKTDKAVSVNKMSVESGILALEVRDAAGNVIPTVPPPIPRAEPELLVIPAGGEHTQAYELNFFSPALEDGVYRVRVRVRDWKSNELQHTLKKK